MGLLDERVRYNPDQERLETVGYRWYGDPLIAIGDQLLMRSDIPPPECGHVFRLGQFLLLMIGRDSLRQTTTAIRLDDWHWPLALARYIGRQIEMRIVWTCEVWGLARRTDYGREPIWRDITPLDWIARWIERFA